MRVPKPNMGKVRPLPRFMRPRFHDLCDEIKIYCDNQRRVWSKAYEISPTEQIARTYIYWDVAYTFLNTVRALGVGRDNSPSDPGHPPSND